MTKYYIAWFYPGSFVSNTVDLEIDPRQSLLEWPDRAYAYKTYEKSYAVVDGETLYGEAKNHSGTTYLGEELTLEDVEKIPDTGILQWNMKANGWKRVVRTKFNQYMPLQDGDVVVSHAN